MQAEFCMLLIIECVNDTAVPNVWQVLLLNTTTALNDFSSSQKKMLS